MTPIRKASLLQLPFIAMVLTLVSAMIGSAIYDAVKDARQGNYELTGFFLVILLFLIAMGFYCTGANMEEKLKKANKRSKRRKL